MTDHHKDKNKAVKENVRFSEREQDAQTDREIAQERYRDLAEGIDHGIVWEADANLRFCMVSKRAERIVGYPPEQWCGEPDFWAGHLHPEERDRILDLFRKASQDGEDQSADHRFIAKDGRTVWFHTGIHAARERSKLVYRGISVEITYLKEVTEKLKEKTAELEEANRFKSHVLAIVSHEIRTPLNAILGYSGLLKNPEIEKAKQREMVDRIYRNAQVLLDFINAILDLSKIEAGKMSVQIEEISLFEIVQEVADHLRSTAEEKGLTVEIACDPSTPPIRSDPGRVWQIFTNLISNAIKFTERGSISVKILNHRPAKKVSVNISDTGVGISDKDLSRIFEPFYQGGVSPSHSGTGLGLSIVKKIG